MIKLLLDESQGVEGWSSGLTFAEKAPDAPPTISNGSEKTDQQAPSLLMKSQPLAIE